MCFTGGIQQCEQFVSRTASKSEGLNHLLPGISGTIEPISEQKNGRQAVIDLACHCIAEQVGLSAPRGTRDEQERILGQPSTV